MNDVLALKGRFEQRKSNQHPSSPKLPKDSKVSADKILSLVADLEQMKKFWAGQSLLSQMLISAYYVKIAAKSNRLRGFFERGTENPNYRIVGAKFDDGPRHVITYFVSEEDVNKTIDKAKESVEILNKYFDGEISNDRFNVKSGLDEIDFNEYSISKTTFQKFVVDAWYVKKFDVERADLSTNSSAIVTLYDTGQPVTELLSKLGINLYHERLLDQGTALLDQADVSILMQRAPYLVAMATEDITKLSPTNFYSEGSVAMGRIPNPTNEPTIGVIDTLFDERVYFEEWVDYADLLDKNIIRVPEDYKHGTEVSSILVDGPSLNTTLDDGCGRFKVKHFGVATHRQFSSFTVIKAIQAAVAQNPTIHVWNLSLGSNSEVNQNFISAEGAALDKIQYENNVIFVVAGTNNNSGKKHTKIGAPADSINSMVVNSVKADKTPADYAREGVVLSFFTKPDIGYYGGESKKPMRTVNSNGEALVAGTSFSAPWIARKLAYMIEILGLSREVSKALIVDSAIGWKPELSHSSLTLIGNGVVPVRIEDVLHSNDDEIKFILEGSSEMWDTYTYNLPVPVVDGKQPFIAKATLCYFPRCSRNQGVDYTNTELDITFGRIRNDGSINSINKNIQSDDAPGYLKEEDARKLFRKWDNVKHITEFLKSNPVPRKVYDNPMWAISLKTKERLNNHDGEHMRFGIVVTLKEMNGVNRIQDFVQQASLKGWLVNRIDVQDRINVFTQAEQDITLE